MGLTVSQNSPSGFYHSGLSGVSYQIEIKLIFTHYNVRLLSEMVTPMVPTQHIVWA